MTDSEWEELEAGFDKRLTLDLVSIVHDSRLADLAKAEASLERAIKRAQAARRMALESADALEAAIKLLTMGAT